MINEFEFNESGELVLRDTSGNEAINTSRRLPHRVAYLQGTAVLPRLSLAPYPDLGPLPDNSTDIALGLVGDATVLGGTWRIRDAEGLARGEIRYLFDESRIQSGQFATSRFRRRFLYAPRRLQSEWYMIGGPTILDMYMFLSSVDINTIETNTSAIPEVGRLWHTIQFVIDNGQLELQRRGRNIAHDYIYLYYSFTNPPQEYYYGFDCAELTIDYRIWLGQAT